MSPYVPVNRRTHPGTRSTLSYFRVLSVLERCHQRGRSAPAVKTEVKTAVKTAGRGRHLSSDRPPGPSLQEAHPAALTAGATDPSSPLRGEA